MVYNGYMGTLFLLAEKIDLSAISIVDIVVGVILILMLVYGLARGFSRIVLKFVVSIVALVCAYFFGAKLGNLFGSIFDVQTRVQELLFDKVFASEIFHVTISQTEQVQAILSERFPEIICELITTFLQNANIPQDVALGSFLSITIAASIFTVLGFVIVFTVVSLLFSAVSRLFQATLLKIHLFGFLDRLLGGVLELLIGFLYLYIILMIGSLFGEGFTNLLDGSYFVKFLYDHNFLIDILKDSLAGIINNILADFEFPDFPQIPEIPVL